MKIVVVSDTHGQHEALGRLQGDVLVHCGDLCADARQRARDLERLDAWFAQQRFERILCIAGNHDFAIESRVRSGGPVFRNATYLQDDLVEHRGIRFYGSPWVPELRGWAFYGSDASRRRRWAAVPGDVDVLITHTPPHGVLDRNSQGQRIGCSHLRTALETLKPTLHCFGHVHASAGLERIGGTTFVNASMIRRERRKLRRPVEIELG